MGDKLQYDEVFSRHFCRLSGLIDNPIENEMANSATDTMAMTASFSRNRRISSAQRGVWCSLSAHIAPEFEPSSSTKRHSLGEYSDASSDGRRRYDMGWKKCMIVRFMIMIMISGEYQKGQQGLSLNVCARLKVETGTNRLCRYTEMRMMRSVDLPHQAQNQHIERT